MPCFISYLRLWGETSGFFLSPPCPPPNHSETARRLRVVLRGGQDRRQIPLFEAATDGGRPRHELGDAALLVRDLRRVFGLLKRRRYARQCERAFKLRSIEESLVSDQIDHQGFCLAAEHYLYPPGSPRRGSSSLTRRVAPWPCNHTTPVRQGRPRCCLTTQTECVLEST